MSYAPEVQAIGNGDKWTDNALRFATEREAEMYVLDLFCRWTAVTKSRVVESSDPVNYSWTDGRLVAIEPGA